MAISLASSRLARTILFLFFAFLFYFITSQPWGHTKHLGCSSSRYEEMGMETCKFNLSTMLALIQTGLICTDGAHGPGWPAIASALVVVAAVVVEHPKKPRQGPERRLVPI